MPNSYFQFKQFRINQETCAMKVGVDGVTLGSWVDVEDAADILDIGTGTGLISLMLAQRSKAKITAIDIDSDCVQQAKENVANSLWNDRILVLESSLQKFAESCGLSFDLIVSNPPFFTDSLKSPSFQRSIARHNVTLNHLDLIQNANRLLSENGKFSVILPLTEEENFCQECQKNGLFCSKKVLVYPNISKPAKRVLLEFWKMKVPCVETELTIETERNVYTKNYQELVSDFYLKL